MAAWFKQSQGEVKTGRLTEAKRPDIGDSKKQCGAIGWEINESRHGKWRFPATLGRARL